MQADTPTPASPLPLLWIKRPSEWTEHGSGLSAELTDPAGDTAACLAYDCRMSGFHCRQVALMKTLLMEPRSSHVMLSRDRGYDLF